MKINCLVCGNDVAISELVFHFGGKSEETKAFCPRCRQEIPIMKLLTGAYRNKLGVEMDLFLEKALKAERALKKVERVWQPDYPLLPGAIYRVEPTEEERKSLYHGAFLLDFILFGLLYIGLVFFFPGIKNLPWIVFFGGLVAARIADMVSTSIALGIGAIETNPLSDPDDMSKLIPLQLFQVITLAILSLLLGLVSPWLGKGVLFVFSLTGFGAAVSNILQVIIGQIVLFPVLGVPPSLSSLSPLFYAAHIISFLIVGTITSLTIWVVL